MIIEIPDENSIVKWKNNDNDEWKVAETSDLIKAYEERRKGEWAAHNTCPFCNHTYDWEYNFCPNCGAKMKGGAE